MSSKSKRKITKAERTMRVMQSRSLQCPAQIDQEKAAALGDCACLGLEPELTRCYRAENGVLVLTHVYLGGGDRV